MAAKKAKVNKAEFVRGLPDDISYADAAAKAKAAGIELSNAYFYVLRSEMKKSARGAEPGRAVTKPEPAKSARNHQVVDLTDHGDSALKLTSANPDENALLDVARKLGIGRVESILSKLKRFETA